ncbi:MAG TPA: hypothetical protein VFO76_08765, partial [Candidatus Kapabacteria bacterium]|nr:hypothetical protein [Candidatus Kapabacteria bacterium]
LREKISELDSSRTGYSLNESEVNTINDILAILGNILVNNEITLIAEDLRSCADKVASLFGLNVSDDNLNYIFHKMCIGK